MGMEVFLLAGAFLFGLPFIIIGLVSHFREKRYEGRSG